MQTLLHFVCVVNQNCNSSVVISHQIGVKPTAGRHKLRQTDYFFCKKMMHHGCRNNLNRDHTLYLPTFRCILNKIFRTSKVKEKKLFRFLFKKKKKKTKVYYQFNSSFTTVIDTD